MSTSTEIDRVIKGFYCTYTNYDDIKWISFKMHPDFWYTAQNFTDVQIYENSNIEPTPIFGHLQVSNCPTTKLYYKTCLILRDFQVHDDEDKNKRVTTWIKLYMS